MDLNDQHITSQLFDDYLRSYTSENDDHTEQFSDDFSGFIDNQPSLLKDHQQWLAASRLTLTAQVRIELKERVIQPLSQTVAAINAVLLLDRSTAQPALPSELAHLAMIFRKEASGWKIVHSTLSSQSQSIESEPSQSESIPPEKALAAQLKQLAKDNDRLRLANEQLTQKIAEQQQATDALRKSEAHFRTMTENSVDVLWKLDAGYHFTYVSPADEKRRGYRADEVLGQHVFSMFNDKGINDIVIAKIQREEAERKGERLTDITFEAKLKCKDGSWIWGEVIYNYELDAAGKVIGFYGTSREITERKQMQDQVHQLAFYDPLTKLPNRNLLNDRLSQARTISKRKKTYGALMFLDLDNFKPINDLHGHIAGDLLLVEVGERLKKCVREMDTVARFGGDEYIIVISELDTDYAKSEEQAQRVAEKIRLSIAERYKLTVNYDEQTNKLVEHSCTASIGVVLFLGQEVSIDDLFKQADSSMYEAKDGGRNAIRFYEPEE